MSFKKKQGLIGKVKNALVNSKIWGRNHAKADDLKDDLDESQQGAVDNEELQNAGGYVMPYKKREDMETGGSGGSLLGRM